VEDFEPPKAEGVVEDEPNALGVVVEDPNAFPPDPKTLPPVVGLLANAPNPLEFVPDPNAENPPPAVVFEFEPNPPNPPVVAPGVVVGVEEEEEAANDPNPED